MQPNNLTRLQNWYRSNCNGDWEHVWGIKIDTLDNPGWKVDIDLSDTCLENAVIDTSFDNGEDDWYFAKTEDHQFNARGDFNKLDKMLDIFFEFLENNADPEFLYELYIPLKSTEGKLWRPVHASMIKEDTFQIAEIRSIADEKNNLQFETIESIGGIDFDNIQDDINLAIGEIVKCDLKRFFNCLGLVIQD